MTGSLRILLAFLFIVLALRSQTADALDVYDSNTLQKANGLYAENLRLMWRDLLGRLTVKERQAAGKVTFHLSVADPKKNPFYYYSNPESREVSITILSVKFFDDLAIAAAWLTRQGCAMDPVSDYLGILRYQNPSLLPGNRFPPPLRALSIPENALKDAFVDDISGKTLKSAIYFLMAHELAHVIYKHKPYNMIDLQEAQAQEMQADEFALDIMRRISVPPMGMVLFFTVCSRFEPAPGDFPTAEIPDFESWVRNTSKHPLTSQRLLAISMGIRRNADAFAQGQKSPTQWRPRILKIADDIQAIGSTLEDRKIREYQKIRGETIRIGDLYDSCR